MPNPTINNPRIKFVKKASQWVKTYFEHTSQGEKQIQEWSFEKPEMK